MHWGNSIWRLFCKAESSPSFHMLGVHLKTPITMRWHSVETDLDTLPGCQLGTGSGMSFWDGKQGDSGLGSLHWSRILVSLHHEGRRAWLPSNFILFSRGFLTLRLRVQLPSLQSQQAVTSPAPWCSLFPKNKPFILQRPRTISSTELPLAFISKSMSNILVSYILSYQTHDSRQVFTHNILLTGLDCSPW